MNRCETCGADWELGAFDPACEECDGGPLICECRACGGTCGSLWARVADVSGPPRRGAWTGTCALTPEDAAVARPSFDALRLSFDDARTALTTRLVRWGWSPMTVAYVLQKSGFEEMERSLRERFGTGFGAPSMEAVQRSALARRWIRMLEASAGGQPSAISMRPDCTPRTFAALETCLADFRTSRRIPDLVWIRQVGAQAVGVVADVELLGGLAWSRERSSGSTFQDDHTLRVSSRGDPIAVLCLHTVVDSKVWQQESGTMHEVRLENYRASRREGQSVDTSQQVYVVAQGQVRTDLFVFDWSSAPSRFVAD